MALCFVRKLTGGAPGWLSRLSIPLLVLAQVMISRFEFESLIGLCADSVEPAWDSLSPHLSLSLQIEEITLKKKKKHRKLTGPWSQRPGCWAQILTSQSLIHRVMYRRASVPDSLCHIQASVRVQNVYVRTLTWT